MLLLDNSAWSRFGSPGLGEQRRREIAEWTRDREIAACLPFALEAGYSARNADEHRQTLELIESLPWVDLGPEVERLALTAQSMLARSGHHRLPPADLMIAACAHAAGTGVLHFDKDYDRIASKTALRFESVWLASAGTL